MEKENINMEARGFLSGEKLKEKFRDAEVPAKSVADFLDRYYKPDRYRGRGEEYAKILLESYEKEFREKGYTCISRHDNVTGRFIAYFGNEELKEKEGS